LQSPGCQRAEGARVACHARSDARKGQTLWDLVEFTP